MAIPDSVFAAFVGAGTAMIAMAVKEVAAPIVGWVVERSQIRRAAAERYAAPLARAAESLFYRLNEILVDERALFLKSSNAKSVYNQYKFDSTLYRVSALLGWIWAIKKEHSILMDHNTKSASSIQDGLGDLESSFADGGNVELWRVKKLCELWQLPLPGARSLSSVAGKSDAILEERLFSSNRDFRDVYSKEQTLILIDLYKSVSVGEDISKLPITREAISAVGEILAVRQAWIYRDWQAAIGELMTVRLEADAARMFDVIGYARFEDLLDGDNKWIERLREIFIDLNPANPDEREFRLKQVRMIHKAIAALLVRLRRLPISQECVGEKCALAAQAVLKRYVDLESRGI